MVEATQTVRHEDTTKMDDSCQTDGQNVGRMTVGQNAKKLGR
jgi:hypothetical protein